jgi:galactonate dehydratase
VTLQSVQVTPKTIWCFVKLLLRDGSTGWGEASVGYADTVLKAITADVHQALVGHRLSSIEKYIAGRGMPELSQAAVLGALDQAYWDVGSRREGRAAAGWQAARVRDDVAVYANMNRRTEDRSPDGFFRSAKATLSSGYTALKIAPFDSVTTENCRAAEGRQGIDQGLARVAALRDAAGPGIQLYVDCHWRFDSVTAAAVLRELTALGVTWFECPIPENEETLAAVKELRGQANDLGVRLAGLEKLTHPDAFLPWLRMGCYDVIMPDVKYAGGITGVLQTSKYAQEHATSCAPHNPTGPVCHAASLAVCAMAPSVDILEHQVDETPLFWDMATGDLPRPVNGRSRISEQAGLGIALKEDYLAYG